MTDLVVRVRVVRGVRVVGGGGDKSSHGMAWHRVTLDDRPGGEGEGSKGVRVLRENSVGRGGKLVRACHVMA